MKRVFGLMTLAVILLAVVVTFGIASAQETEKPKFTQLIRDAFSNPEGIIPLWLRRVRFGQDRGSLESICDMLKATEKKHLAFEHMEEKGITWPELKLPFSETDARTALAREDKKNAEDLFKILKTPFAIRDGVFCSKGILRDFGDGIEVLELVLSSLWFAGATPADIESNEAELREMALAEFRTQIEAGRVNRSSDGKNYPFFTLVCNAIKGWNFSLVELGLTMEEEAEMDGRNCGQ